MRINLPVTMDRITMSMYPHANTTQNTPKSKSFLSDNSKEKPAWNVLFLFFENGIFSNFEWSKS